MKEKRLSESKNLQYAINHATAKNKEEEKKEGHLQAD